MNFRGRRAVILEILATFLLPFETLAVPLFLGLNIFHLADSYFSLAIPPAANAFNVFLIMQFFRSLPRSESFAVVMAASVLSTIPAVNFFIMFQRYFVKGIATSGLKG